MRVLKLGSSFPASGGPCFPSAGSLDRPSVSCCHLSTSPTCTVCGEPRLSGAGGGEAGSTLFIITLLSCRAHECTGDGAEPGGPFSQRLSDISGSRLSRTRQTNCLCFMSVLFFTSCSIIKAERSFEMKL